MNIVFDWQSLQPYTGPNATFFQSCDALEVKNGVNAPASGWGLAHALPAFGSYFKNIYLPARRSLNPYFSPDTTTLLFFGYSMRRGRSKVLLFYMFLIKTDIQSISDCLGTYNASQSFYTNTTINNAERSWTWSRSSRYHFAHIIEKL